MKKVLSRLLRAAKIPLAAAGLSAKRLTVIAGATIVAGVGLGMLVLGVSEPDLSAADKAAMVVRFAPVASLLSVMFSVHFVLSRLSGDHEAQWPLILFGRGVGRSEFVLAVVGIGATIGGAFYILLLGGLSLTVGIPPGMLRLAAKSGLIVGGYSTLAALIGLVALRSSQVYLVAGLVMVIPFLALGTLYVRFGPLEIPGWLESGLLMHLPPTDSGMGALFLYCAAILPLVVYLAEKRFGRYD